MASGKKGFGFQVQISKFGFFTGANGDNRDELKTLFPLLPPVKK